MRKRQLITERGFFRIHKSLVKSKAENTEYRHGLEGLKFHVLPRHLWASQGPRGPTMSSQLSPVRAPQQAGEGPHTARCTPPGPFGCHVPAACRPEPGDGRNGPHQQGQSSSILIPPLPGPVPVGGKQTLPIPRPGPVDLGSSRSGRKNFDLAVR